MLDLSKLSQAIRYEGTLSRRLFLAYGTALSSLPLLGRASWADANPTFDADPFSLGVASGDPDDRGAVLWTRLAPAPLEPNGGMPATPIEVAWEVANDEGMQDIVASGTTIATPQLGHSVHVELDNLEADRWYWYRFHAGEAVSPIGRTRTLPTPDASVDRMKFAFASCQHYEMGLFTAYEQMARDDLDLVFHLGDYIYEGAGREGLVRQHIGAEIESLGDYRVRLSQYRADPLLHGMHAKCPWFVTWDDHEFDNNYAGDISEQTSVDPVDFLIRRANAYQAYYEMMPLRQRSLPRGPHLQLYRKASFGRLAELMVLDTRQYRSDQPNDDRKSPLNDAALDPGNSLLGAEQRDWLGSALIQSRATWNVLAQQVMMGMVSFRNDDADRILSMDQWPGCAHERMQLLKFIAERRVPNPVVLTGDIHANWVNNLRVDDRVEEQPIVATEFVGTSITSGGNGVSVPSDIDDVTSHNPCVGFYNRERGYVRCTLTPDTWTSDYMVVDDITRPGGNVSKRASFVIEAGEAGAKQA